MDMDKESIGEEVREEAQEEALVTESRPGLMRRMFGACGRFFSRLPRLRFRRRAKVLADGEELQPEDVVQPEDVDEAAPSMVRETSHEAALQLLGLLQRDARFIDFIEEDIAAYGDADIGAAARIVHEGCRKVLREHFSIQPLRPESEGSRITLNEGFNASEVRLAGNVVGRPPFTGSLRHRGWRVVETRLPRLAESHDPAIVAQAEVEL